MQKSRQELVAFLLERLNERRFRHSLGVERLSIELAGRFGADQDKASTAGLLHDCAKNLSDEELLQRGLAYGIKPDEIYLYDPALLHGPAGAWTAREELGITDPEILSAICWHTIPSGNMSILDKVVHVADMAEENRTFPGVEHLRETLKVDLDRAYLEAIQRVITHLLEHGRPIHPNAIFEYNGLIMQYYEKRW